MPLRFLPAERTPKFTGDGLRLGRIPLPAPNDRDLVTLEQYGEGQLEPPAGSECKEVGGQRLLRITSL